MLDFIRHMLTKNLGTKIMALFLSILVWVYINRESSEPDTLNVPLKIITDAQVLSRAEIMETGEVINEVKVKVKYPKGHRESVISGIVCSLKVKPGTDLQVNETSFPELTGKDFNFSPTVRVENISPPRIRLILFKEASKFMRLKAEDCISGALVKGYRVAGIKAIPSEILVKGPKHILDKYDKVPISRIDVTGRNSSFSQLGRIEATLDNEKIFTEDSFIVEVTINEEVIEQVLQIPISVLLPPNFPYRLELKPNEIGVKVKGPASGIKALKERHINLFVNISALYNKPEDIAPPRILTAPLELRFAPDAPSGIELSQPLEKIRLDIMEPAPAPEKQPEKPPEQPPPTPPTPQPPSPPVPPTPTPPPK
ncbi:MAG: YbbR-like domain-containing protein [Planctomycetes bacterium]|nr:YbbR-like domain-containing protein [Planctomycetota bacterium]